MTAKSSERLLHWTGCVGASVSLFLGAPGCQGWGSAKAGAGSATPIYNSETGKLEQLVADRNGDGKIDTRAFMEGVRLKRIEIDRNGDGKPDRWEYYVAVAGAGLAGAAPAAQTTIDHVEEANGSDDRITRREFFANGLVRRVEEDSDLNGQMDKWEHYEKGILARVDLDLQGKGFPDRRLVYNASGSVTRVEADPDGDGKFELASPAGKGGV